MDFPVPGASVLAQSAGLGGAGNLIFLALMFVAFYFLLIRPQRKRQQDQRKMQQSLQIGDVIETIGGFRATIRRMGAQVLTVELSPGVEARISRRAVGSRIEEDDLVKTDEVGDEDDELEEDEVDELTDEDAAEQDEVVEEDVEPAEVPGKQRGRKQR